MHFAAAGLVTGQYDVVVAGGVESMSRAPMGSAMSEGTYGDAVLARYADALAAPGRVDLPPGPRRRGHRDPMGPVPRASWTSSRSSSHERAAAAADSGAFDEQLAPVTCPDGTTVTADEGIRAAGRSVEALAGLRTAFRPDGDGHRGNASQISDGAAALLMTTSERAARARPDARWPGCTASPSWVTTR